MVWRVCFHRKRHRLIYSCSRLTRPFRRKKCRDYGIVFVIRSFVFSFVRSALTLWKLELSKHWTDSLQIKFTETVLACRCATPWSFAHRGLMGVPMGVISARGTLFTGQGLSSHPLFFFCFFFNNRTFIPNQELWIMFYWLTGLLTGL